MGSLKGHKDLSPLFMSSCVRTKLTYSLSPVSAPSPRYYNLNFNTFMLCTVDDAGSGSKSEKLTTT